MVERSVEERVAKEMIGGGKRLTTGKSRNGVVAGRVKGER
jgi:hypothetical protein